MKGLMMALGALSLAGMAAASGLMASPGQFHSWVDGAQIMRDLQPSQEELQADAFLELVAEGDGDDPLDMFSLLGTSDKELEDQRVLGHKACDPGYDCSKFQEGSSAGPPVDKAQYYKPDKAAPEKLFPVGRIPRSARCWLTCDYQTSYAFAANTSLSEDTPEQRAALRMAATSYLETSETVSQAPDLMSTEQLGSPFHCKTKCDFTEPKFCNPTRRMLVGATGMAPQENQCCEKCDSACKGKTILNRYRICYLGCRAYCPFVDFDEFAKYHENLS